MLPKKYHKGFALIILVVFTLNGLVNAADEYNCYRCVGDACEDPEVSQCSLVVENPLCYTQFDSRTKDIIAMGCISDFPDEATAIVLIKARSLLVCEGELCNGFENLLPINQCIQCNSTANELCATNPSYIGNAVTCSSVPYRQCYQRVNSESGSITERGCLNSLSNERFYSCLVGEDELCKICVGENCNNENIPEDRLKCQRCSSDDESICHNSPNSLEVCPVYSANDRCVGSYEDGITKRGCVTDFSCAGNGKNCQTCSGDGCNVINLKKRDTEIYGIFQSLPLNCYFCSGNNCEGAPTDVHKCENFNYQDCITVFNTTGEVLARGCEEDTQIRALQSHCAGNPQLCLNCKSNGCNNILDSTNSQQCLYCDSTVNSDCLLNPGDITTTRTCVEGCVTSLYPRKNNTNVLDLVRTCFEDIEEDDREQCQGDNCNVCTSDNNCNNVILPIGADRLSCLHCVGSNCNEPYSQTCLGYAENDQCYIYFENVTYSATQMGCRSELIESELQANIKQYLLCDGDNCNTFENIPEAHICYVCNSETDENCAVNPTKVTGKARCQIYPYTQCFTRLTSDNHTQRGCHYSLELSDFLECQSEDNSKCQLCSSTSCNAEIFPIDRPQCYRCSSEIDVNCESSPDVAQPCPLYLAEDSCTTKLIDGVTQRGCGNELSCTNSSRRYCQSCFGNNCNAIDLFDSNIGDPGLFQSLPLNCYSCANVQSCATLDNAVKCEGDRLQTCTTVFASNGSVVSLGCSDSIDSQCSELDNNCYDCKSNGCNSAKSEDDYIECLFCDAQNNENCLFNVSSIKRTRKCHQACISVWYPRSKDTSPAYEFLRTCWDDLDLDERAACQAGDSSKCVYCSGENCNVDEVVERKSCLHCVDGNCTEPISKSCRAYLENEQCLIEYDESGDLVDLGCRSKYDEDDINLLLQNKRIWLCDEENCNSVENLPTPSTCILCSSRTDENCAIDVNSLKVDTVCNRQPYTQCYTRVLDGGYTERGCLSNLESNEFFDCLLGANTTKCLACQGDHCNKELFPADRRSCQVCSSNTTSNCESLPQHSQTCLLYNVNDHCVTSLDSNGVTTRGCNSLITCDSKNSKNCQICVNDNCNTVNLKRKIDGNAGVWQDLPISCLSCNNAEDCSNADVAKCAQNEYCMTVFQDSTTVVSRGCSDAVEASYETYCDSNDGLCYNCNSNECNKAVSLNDYVECIYCDSETNDNCVLNANDVSETRWCLGSCMTSLYSPKNNSVYELTRTCLDDKENADQSICTAGTDNFCKACTDSQCNIDIVPASRLSCFVCENGCESAVETTCKAYTENDSCYTLFNNNTSIVQLGCLSDLDDSFVVNNQHLLYFCSTGDNCNSFENVPKTRLCAVCDSSVDAECAINPANIAIYDQCTTLPNTQCYTRINNDGTTSRGCVGSLEISDLLTCVSGNSSTCATCEEDSCNTEVYPENRRSCIRCDSRIDSNCENSPKSAASICPIYDENDRCVTEAVTNYLIRGCSSEFTCNVNDKNNCQICDSDNCNTANLLSKNIGEPGKWQDLPLTCHTCEGSSCITSTATAKCENNNLQNCVTVFDAVGVVEKRGCSDVIATSHEDYCNENPNNCPACKSNLCNDAVSLDNYVDCYFCDSATSSSCGSNFNESTRTRKCQKSCVIALYPRTSVVNSSYETSRSCLDDLEENDRLSCAAGEKNLCYACDGSKCNNVEFPENRLSCYQCYDDDCEEPTVATCSTYHPEDQCYTVFDQQNTVLGMGCRSEFDPATVEYLIRNKAILLCDGNDCNNFENLPTLQSCSICNSAVDSRCATNPNLVANKTQCSSLPYTDCYTRVNENGHTERGCLASLGTLDFVGCLTNTDELCETCTGNNCNEIDVYPTNRRTCYQCDSRTDPTCVDAPTSNTVCPIYAPNDACISSYDNGVTIRGCYSDTECHDETNGRNCRICYSSGCNTDNLEKSNADGEPGKWQDLPISCYTCQNATDCASEELVEEKCAGNNNQNCITVFENDVVIERGCSDVVEVNQLSYCNSNDGKCPRCNSNLCNTAKSLNEYEECVYCDSHNDLNCVWNANNVSLHKTRQCQGGCMTALYPSDLSDNPAYELIRTCLNDKEVNDQVTCSNNGDSFCAACSDDNCNVVDLPADRLSCYTCSNGDCETPVSQLCPLYRKEDQCFIWFDDTNSVSDMGCVASFRVNDLETILKTKRVLVCDGDNCNNFDILPSAQKCAVCDSGVNAECATNANLVGNFSECIQQPYTSCYSRIDGDGATIRGCLSDLSENNFIGCLLENDANCEVCAGEGCNREVYPADRLQCHTCNSEVDDDCESEPELLNACRIYGSQINCVTALTNNVTIRGCSSDVFCDNSDSSSCRSCSVSGCNGIDLRNKVDDGYHGVWQDLPLRCHICEGEHCLQSLGPAYECLGDLSQDCMTVFDVDGQVKRRGCANDVEDYEDYYCRQNPGYCFTCKSNECNIAWNLTDYVQCAFCNSSTNALCAVDPTHTEFATRACYKDCMVALHGQETVRSCLDDKESLVQGVCRVNESGHECSSCSGDECNKNVFPTDRLKCHVCTGAACYETLPEYCVNYVENDFCFAKYGNGKLELLGCGSSENQSVINEWREENLIFECHGNECNDLPKLPVESNCVSCDSEKTLECAQKPEAVTTTTSCYALNNQCVTTIVDGHTIRGCLDSMDRDEQNSCVASGKCSVCDGDKCNTNIFPIDRRQCHICNSVADSNCAKSPNAIAYCPIYVQNDTCVATKDEETIIRDCGSSSLTCDVNDKDHCQICNENSCNIADVSGSATFIVSSLVFTISLLSMLVAQ